MQAVTSSMERFISRFQRLMGILFVALQIQLAPALGYLFCLGTSIFYIFLNDSRYQNNPLNQNATEKPEIFIFAFLASLLFYWIGSYGSKKLPVSDVHQKTGVLAVTLAWFICCSLSSVVFMWSGFPIPGSDFSLFRQFVDGFFESMSGFTTTGASILPNVEAFPRSILMWRGVTHWLGGMGIAYMTLSLIKNFRFKRAEIINAEAETPVTIQFNSEAEAKKSGIEFLQAYLVMTVALVVLLYFSGVFFRLQPYTHWSDNLYDALVHTFGTVGTGGFSSYNKSVGLPESANMLIGGLMNPVSEWIIGFGMMFSGMNFGLWYVLFFDRKAWFKIWQNRELKVYLGVVTLTTLGIWYGLLTDIGFIQQNPNYANPLDALRYAFFNVNTIITTTGFGNTDFTKWPALASGVLFICFLTGAMVGSTGGGLKISRFMVLFEHLKVEIKNMVYGTNNHRFEIDGIKYTRNSVTIVLATIVIYFGLFFSGSILIMAFNPTITNLNGEVKPIDFISAMMSTLATLGNIGPAAAVGTVDAGPNGNYFVFSEASKIVMIALMYLGRVGVLALLILFVRPEGEEHLKESIPEAHYESDIFLLKS